MDKHEILQIIADILMAIIGVLSGHHVIRNHIKDRNRKKTKLTRRQKKIATATKKLQELEKEKMDKQLENREF